MDLSAYLLGAKRAFDAYAFLSVLLRLYDEFLDETSARSTRLQMNFAFMSSAFGVIKSFETTPGDTDTSHSSARAHGDDGVSTRALSLSLY